jgi:hypothetical protein
MIDIEFDRENISLREEVEVFGERDIEELTIEYSERDEFELEIDTGGHVSLESLVDVQYTDEGDIESLTLRFDQLPSIQANARRRTDATDDELGPVPEVDVSEIEVGGRRSFYERMRDSSESQPAEIRRLIHEHQELEREEFDRLVDDELGYASDGGGTNMSLVVLENLTEEIERHGRGDDQTIVWTG